MTPPAEGSRGAGDRPGPGTPTVLAGADGYLFLTGGAHDVKAFFTGERRVRPQSVRQFQRNLRLRARYCRMRGIGYAHVVFPDKVAVLTDQVPFEATSLLQRDFVQEPELQERLGLMYPLAALQGRGDVFHRTDTHYAAAGNLALAEAICARLGPQMAKALREVLEQGGVTGPHAGFCGDLGSKLDPPQREEAEVLLWPGDGIEMATNGVQHANDGVLLLAESEIAATNRTLLIFGDSFYRQMMPLLVRLFRRVVFCRTRFFHPEMVPAVAPDVILTGMAERYLGTTRLDETRPHFLSIPFANGRATAPEPGFAALWDRMIDAPALLQPETF